MIYTKFFSRKYRAWFRVCALTILFAFSLTLYSCQTVYEKSYKAEEFGKLDNANDGKIIELHTADSIYNSGKYNMEYISKKGVKPSYFILGKMDTVLVKSSTKKMLRVTKTLSELKTAEVNRVKVEHIKIDWGNTMLFMGGIVVIAVVIATLAAPKKEMFSLRGWNNLNIW